MAEKKIEHEMRKMNEAAMAAYMGDLAQGSDFTAKQINARAEAAAKAAAVAAVESSRASSSSSKPTIGPKVDPLAITLPEDEAERKAKIARAVQAKKESLWCEAATDEGFTYYWNVKTGESVWEAPKEGFMSLKEYEKIQQIGEEKAAEQERKEFLDTVKNSDEIAAALKREQHKKMRIKAKNKEKAKEDAAAVKEEKEAADEKYGWEDPDVAARPLGKWQVVETKKYVKNTTIYLLFVLIYFCFLIFNSFFFLLIFREESFVDLQLPTQSYEPIYVPAVNVETEVPVKKFKEKTITSIDADEPGFFKRRKIAGGSRNVRKPVNDN